MKTHAILIHGMGRTPAAMLILAARLHASGLHPVLYSYSATFEGWDHCVARLAQFVNKHTGGEGGSDNFIMVGHSLGTVLTRAVLSKLSHKPLACFFLAPPCQACFAARSMAGHFAYRLLTGEMGQLLASQPFMNSLPLPNVPTKIYAGTGGPTGRYSPFGTTPNDGILTVEETALSSVPQCTVPAVHTFIMNDKMVAEDIVAMTAKLTETRTAKRTANEPATAASADNTPAEGT